MSSHTTVKVNIYPIIGVSKVQIEMNFIGRAGNEGNLFLVI